MQNSCRIVGFHEKKYVYIYINIHCIHHLFGLHVPLLIISNVAHSFSSRIQLFHSRLHTLQTVQVKTRAFCAAAFWSGPPWAFLSFSCFCAFFCWDWNFWWPRAIGNYSVRKKKKSRIYYYKLILESLLVSILNYGKPFVSFKNTSYHIIYRTLLWIYRTFYSL